jgi:hypothetical protein
MTSQKLLGLQRGVHTLCTCLWLISAAACAGDDDQGDDDDGLASQPAAPAPVSVPNTITLKPFVATGAAIEAVDKTWTYVEFPDTKCRDGSPAGIALSKNSASTKLMIYLEGGGGCFDQLTCLANPTNTSLFKAEKTTGVFNRANPENPVGDWNVVYVPYCTGDIHGGTRSDVTLDGVSGVQQFVGYLNIKQFLQRIVPTFPGATDVLLTGISAGGFGAALNAVSIAEAFPAVKMKVIDDSGPGVSTAVVPECLQQKWREIWGLDQSFLKDCGDACANKNDYMQTYALAMTRTFQDRPSGLIESLQDGTITRFFAAGNNNCTGTALVEQVPIDVYQGDLLAFREKAKEFPLFGTYLPAGNKHTWLSDDGFYSANAGGVRLVDWVAKIVRGEAPGNAGP